MGCTPRGLGGEKWAGRLDNRPERATQAPLSWLFYWGGGGSGTERLKARAISSADIVSALENMRQDFRGYPEGTHFTDVEAEVEGSSFSCPQISKAIHFGGQDVKADASVPEVHTSPLNKAFLFQQTERHRNDGERGRPLRCFKIRFICCNPQIKN